MPSVDAKFEATGRRVVILGTGGTIAGRAGSELDNVHYRAGSVSPDELVHAVPALAAWPLECETVAQLDSKDMDAATWQALARRCAHHLSRPEVAGLVVTHGTDTLEETAWFLHRVVPAVKPVVLTAAMRPATSLQADGPQNLYDAVTLASQVGCHAVIVAFAGRVHAAADVQKVHSYRLEAFDSPDAGALARLEEGRMIQLRAWPMPASAGSPALTLEPRQWPYVALLVSHGGADARTVHALVAAGVRGLVVAGTGNGTLHVAFEAALRAARKAGVEVRRASRCAAGGVVTASSMDLPDDPWPAYEGLNAVKSRVELMLELMGS